MTPLLSNFVLTLLVLVLVVQSCRIGAAIKGGKTYRVRWLVLSMVMMSAMCSGALLMPATSAVVFASIGSALKTILSFLLILGGSWLTFPLSKAMTAAQSGGVE